MHLQALGLMQGGVNVNPEANKPVLFSYDGKNYEIRERAVHFAGLRILSFTQVGLELYPLAAARPVPGYIDAIKRLAEKHNCELVEV